jgi:hypothetical protein
MPTHANPLLRRLFYDRDFEKTVSKKAKTNDFHLLRKMRE